VRLLLLPVAALFVVTFGSARPAAQTALSFEPSSLRAAETRIRNVDLESLARDLERAGLAMPRRIHVTLVRDGDPRAPGIPRWIVGLALEPDDVVIFPERVLPYPYDSMESVFRHEVTHLALAARAGGQRLPRWFHEGVAVSVDAGWDIRGRLRLLVEMAGRPGMADLARLFASSTEPDAAQAYGLSAALIADLRGRHGQATPGAVAARVGDGVPFQRAFFDETGVTPDDAAARAWAGYRRWTMWVPIVTSEATVWGIIVVLAFAAFLVRIRRRALRRRQWEDEETAEIG
jgi:hypothetical protein